MKRPGMRNEYNCGCWIRYDNAGAYLIEWCPLHKAAPDLLEACKMALSCMAPEDDDITARKLRQAISKATSEGRDEG